MRAHTVPEALRREQVGTTSEQGGKAPSMPHGIANLFLGPSATSQFAIPPGELLDAGLLVQLGSSRLTAT